jgi:hypothetical protein
VGTRTIWLTPKETTMKKALKIGALLLAPSARGAFVQDRQPAPTPRQATARDPLSDPLRP